MKDKPVKNLNDVEDGSTTKIAAVLAGKVLTKRLADLGLVTGAEIKVLGRTLFAGPIQVEVCGSRLVLGQGLASKIMVESE
jgi:Fe2+ transport system protein FeoA